jgi:alginate O-acetyltransferase complex protein AlgI
MAVGLGKMLGFTFPENFNYPYTARSISDFWRRWHMTLGNWFKHYVYFPLGGSRGHIRKTVRNLGIVWLLTGIWHGANITFVVWGMGFGLFVIAEKLVAYSYEKSGRTMPQVSYIVSNVYVMLVVTVMWTFFDLPTIGDSMRYISVMFGRNYTVLDGQAAYLIMNYSIIFAICIFAATDISRRCYTYLHNRVPTVTGYATVIVVTAVFLACAAYLVNAGYNPFLYFNF